MGCMRIDKSCRYYTTCGPGVFLCYIFVMDSDNNANASGSMRGGDALAIEQPAPKNEPIGKQFRRCFFLIFGGSLLMRVGSLGSFVTLFILGLLFIPIAVYGIVLTVIGYKEFRKKRNNFNVPMRIAVIVASIWHLISLIALVVMVVALFTGQFCFLGCSAEQSAFRDVIMNIHSYL